MMVTISINVIPFLLKIIEYSAVAVLLRCAGMQTSIPSKADSRKRESFAKRACHTLPYLVVDV